MNWTDQHCLSLIEKYRAHECLWNPSDSGYRSVFTKNAAWKQISDELDLPVEETKKKLNSLLASFRRERAKDGRLVVDAEKKKMYHSKWFAFKHMNFLMDRYQGKDAEETRIDEIEEVSDNEIFFNTKDEIFENSDSQDNKLETDIFENVTCSEVFNVEETHDNEEEDLLPKKKQKVLNFEMEFDTKVHRHVDWTDTNSLLLIEEYRAHECLWNPINVGYRTVTRKAAAWEEIAERFDVPQKEIKKKMNSLLASFRRERAKEGTTVLEMGREKIYQSRWFAFKPMSFLLDRFNQNQLKHFEETNKNNPEIEDESDTFFNIKDEMEVSEIEIKDFEPDILENLSTSSIVLKPEHSPEIKIEHSKPKRTPKLHKLKKLRKIRKSKDKFVEAFQGSSTEKSVVDAFGEYVVLKLKEYDSYVRNTIEHKISEIFFQADRGCFDKPSHPQ